MATGGHTAGGASAAGEDREGGSHAAGEDGDGGTFAVGGGPAGAALSGGDGPAGVRRGDTVASVVGQWRAVHPGLDTGPMEIIGRINRCAALLQQAEDAPLRRAGLSRPEFDLLGALRRTGHELTPGELARETFSSGAAVTKRVKQLTERGLVERRGDSRDRRVAHLRLTDAGRDLVDAVLPAQLAYEAAALSGMDAPDQGELAALLGALLGQLEGRLGGLRA
ncbi:MarR family winged helix-turn-helix transcriptional regulator [Streptomyces venetus]|uniref:MarR family winged helix-turn-helix transcriptional regulator n=1 Tax=Streptomyces venetus TaxID=1701086 RepID=UPI003C2EAEC2